MFPLLSSSRFISLFRFFLSPQLKLNKWSPENWSFYCDMRRSLMLQALFKLIMWLFFRWLECFGLEEEFSHANKHISFHLLDQMSVSALRNPNPWEEIGNTQGGCPLLQLAEEVGCWMQTWPREMSPKQKYHKRYYLQTFCIITHSLTACACDESCATLLPPP